MGLDRHRCWALEKSTFNRKGWSSRPEVAADPLPGMMTIPFCRHDSICDSIQYAWLSAFLQSQDQQRRSSDPRGSYLGKAGSPGEISVSLSVEHVKQFHPSEGDRSLINLHILLPGFRKEKTLSFHPKILYI